MAEKSLPAQQKKDRAPDNNIRIGTGNADGSVTVQGAVINAGFIFGTNFDAGDSVVLVRQDKSWFCLGVVKPNLTSAIDYQAGRVLFTFTTQTSAFIDVVFARPFSGIPSASVTIASNAGVTNTFTAHTAFTSTTGMRITVISVTGSAQTWSGVPVDWNAMTMTQ